MPADDSPSPPAPGMPGALPKRRGAPLGNVNAVRHGFYSRRLKKRDVSDLQNTDFKGLSEEIELLRVYIRQMVDMSKDVKDIFTAMELMRVICLGASNLARLLRVQHILYDPMDEFNKALDEAIERLHKDVAEAEVDAQGYLVFPDKPPQPE